VSWTSEHPALAADSAGRVCANPRCATLLAPDAEICDECGGSLLTDLSLFPVILCGWADGRPVVFGLAADRPSIVGRSASTGPSPDVDLRRFPASDVVHRRHAFIELEDGEWRVTHVGTNALIVTGTQSTVLEQGQTVSLRSGDFVEVGGVPLQFVLRDSARRIRASP
jgi:FHA domain